MIEKARRFEDIQIGDEITPLVKELAMARMMAYGAATWDFIRLHYDADYARELGFEAPFVDGQMMGGFLTQHVQDWAGSVPPQAGFSQPGHGLSRRLADLPRRGHRCLIY